MDVVFGDGFAAQRGLGAEALRRQETARHVDDDAADLDAGHALGRVDGEARGVLGRLEIDDRAALDAVRALVADAEDLAAVRAARSALDGSIGVNRAIRQTIFEAPMSRTDRIALLRAGIWRMRGGSGRKLMAALLSSPRARRPRSAASCVSRTNVRPGVRKSSASTSRSRMRDSRWRRSKVAIASCGFSSGSLISMPSVSLRSQLR